MFGKKKKEQQLQVKMDTLVVDTAYALDDFMSQAEGSDELLARLGLSREQVFNAVMSDDEVESCREDLRTAMMASSWRLYGDKTDDAQIDRLYRAIRKNLATFVELVLTARFNGYAVGRYIYRQDPDGFITLDRIADRRDELEKYKPKVGGRLIFAGQSGEEELDTQIQHLLLVNKPTGKNPAGEMAVARLYPAVSVRKQGFLYAHQFVKRYAQPYMVGKLGSNDSAGFISKLFSFISGGAITINSDDDIQMLQNAANGEGFEKLEKMANSRIQKLLLGRVKTSELNSGSRSAQETEEGTRQDRIDAYLGLLGLAIQHAIDALVTVNALWGTEIRNEGGLWFEFSEEIKVDKTRAERDKMYADTGMVRFTKEYFTQVLGFEAEHFELLESTPSTPPAAALSVKLSQTQPSKTPLAQADSLMMQPKVEAIMLALANSQSYAEFDNALATLDLSEGDQLIIDRLVGEGVRSFAGGLMGEPHE